MKKIFILLLIIIVPYIGKSQWKQMNNGLSVLNGSQRCVYYKNGTILLGINNSRYIYRSTDEGKLWLPSNQIFTWDGIVTDIKELNGVLYAATPDGVFISTNDGVFWTLLKASPIFSHCIHIITNKILVGTSGGELYETNNGGQTFTLVNKFSKWVYSITNDKDFIYVATDGSGVFRRNLTSGTWSQVNKGLVGLNSTSIFASNGVILVSSNFRLHLSIDQGSNWKYVTDGWTYNAFSQINYILLAGSISDGVKLSYDNGNTWSAFNEGLTDLDVYSLGLTDSNIIAGTWKSGVFFRPIKDLIKCNLVCQISSVILPCKGLFTATAIASIANGTAPYQYKWNNNQTTEKLTNVSAGTYTVTVTDANGCTASQSITITENPTPSITTASTKDECEGKINGEASINVSSGKSPYQYKWSNGNTTNKITNVKAGSYSVIVTDANGCTSSMSVNIKSIPKSISDFNSSITTKTVTFTNLSTNAISYLWEFGDQMTSTEKSPIHSYNQSGEYNVCLTAYGCDTAKLCKKVVINPGVATKDLADDINWSFTPNPSKDMIYLDLRSIKERVLSVNLYAPNGTKVDEIPILKQKSIIEYECSICPSGLYYIQVNTEQGGSTKKVILIR